MPYYQSWNNNSVSYDWSADSFTRNFRNTRDILNTCISWKISHSTRCIFRRSFGVSHGPLGISEGVTFPSGSGSLLIAPSFFSVLPQLSSVWFCPCTVTIGAYLTHRPYTDRAIYAPACHTCVACGKCDRLDAIAVAL